MKIQKKPDYLIFADDAKTGELESFPNILRGWGVTIDQTQSKPPMEWMNGVFHRIDENTLYLLQQGVPEWDNNVLYPVDAVIKYKSKLYIATVQNDNVIPSTNTTKWSKVVPDTIDASTTQKGVVKLNSAINSTSTTEAATPSAVKITYDLANTDATTSVKGRVQLNSSINSVTENQAATPKAVKAAYDLANGRLPLAGGIVTGTTNFTGKLQQAGSDVITEFTVNNYLVTETVLYPSGSQSSPPKINNNQRIIIDNPYPTAKTIVQLEIKPTTGNYEWATYDGSDDNGQPIYCGIKANKLGTKIVIQTAQTYILRPSFADCNPFNISSHIASVYYRIKVIKLGI